MTSTTQPTLDGIRAAADLIHGSLPATPLLRSELISSALDADVWLKYETVTPIASFKIRGALNAVAKAKARGVRGAVAASTGNHGQGVAYAARLKGLSADIFLPNPANPIKARMIDSFGGTVHEVGEDFDIAKDAAREFAAGNGLMFVDDGEDIDVMEGAGTVGLEIATDLDPLDLVLVPMGGGNLCAGCVTAIKALQPASRVVSVQAKGSPAVTQSFHARSVVEHPIDTLADGLVTRKPASLAIEVLWDQLDDAWLSSDTELLAAVHTLMQSAHVLVEPAGAAALAGAWSQRDGLRGKRVVMLLTGANISSDLMQQALATEPLFPL